MPPGSFSPPMARIGEVSDGDSLRGSPHQGLGEQKNVPLWMRWPTKVDFVNPITGMPEDLSFAIHREDIDSLQGINRMGIDDPAFVADHPMRTDLFLKFIERLDEYGVRPSGPVNRAYFEYWDLVMKLHAPQEQPPTLKIR